MKSAPLVVVREDLGDKRHQGHAALRALGTGHIGGHTRGLSDPGVLPRL
jgi:hypothetical protein